MTIHTAFVIVKHTNHTSAKRSEQVFAQIQEALLYTLHNLYRWRVLQIYKKNEFLTLTYENELRIAVVSVTCCGESFGQLVISAPSQWPHSMSQNDDLRNILKTCTWRQIPRTSRMNLFYREVIFGDCLRSTLQQFHQVEPSSSMIIVFDAWKASVEHCTKHSSLQLAN